MAVNLLGPTGTRTPPATTAPTSGSTSTATPTGTQNTAARDSFESGGTSGSTQALTTTGSTPRPPSFFSKVVDGAKQVVGGIVQGAKDFFSKLFSFGSGGSKTPPTPPPPPDAGTKPAEPGPVTDPATKPAPNLPQGPIKDDLGEVGTPAGGTARVPNDPEDLKDRNGVPWISQLKPTGAGEDFQNGQFYCGPASVAMEARKRGYGAELSDAELITKLAEVGKTKPVTGTSMNGIVAMAKEIGVPVDKTEVKFPGFDATWTDEQLGLGKTVVANGALETPEGPSGHFILVVGKDEKGDYKINDPWDSEKKRMTLDELGAFMARNPVHKGASVALG